MKLNTEQEKKKKRELKRRTPKKKRRVRARTNENPKLVDLDLMKPHNFMSETLSTQNKIYPLTPIDSKNKYEVENEEIAQSAILKLIVKTNQSKALSIDWSTILWDVTQRLDGLRPDVMVTFTRHFEKIDDNIAKKRIKNRRKLSMISSTSGKSRKAQTAFVNHDAGLIHALDIGDGVMAFGAEAIITAPNERKLEEAMNVVQSHIRGNDETRGLSYELDINKQMQPFLLYGPNPGNKNKDVYTEATVTDAAISAMFVDSGGDRSENSEYIGVSVGKMIRSHAAYPLQHPRSFIVGNDTVNRTYTLSPVESMPESEEKEEAKARQQLSSQIYWSHAISRSYLLDGHSVTHFVLDRQDSVNELMQFGLDKKNKVAIDVSKGLLNMLELIADKNFQNEEPNRIVSRFSTHLNNIVALLTQYRDKTQDEISITDDFAAVTKKILNNFFVSNKYYADNPLENIDDLRLTGSHDQYKTLSDFGGWVAQQRESNVDKYLTDGLAELDIIINDTILPTVPALDTVTSPVVDDFLNSKYRVADLTGLNIGSITSSGDSTTNVMMISYLNILLPTLKNGDVIFIHGLSRVEGINKLLQDMIDNSGLRINIVYTESNENRANVAYHAIQDELDFVVVDLYQNKVDKIADKFGIELGYAEDLARSRASYFLRTKNGADYIYLDDIL